MEFPKRRSINMKKRILSLLLLAILALGILSVSGCTQYAITSDGETFEEGKSGYYSFYVHWQRDYFKELLERVRSIRASERRIWQQITDIFAECSIDYDKNDPITHEFYALVQNKFHYAITGQTAA